MTSCNDPFVDEMGFESSFIPISMNATVAGDGQTIAIEHRVITELSLAQLDDLNQTGLHSHGYVLDRDFGPELTLLLSKQTVGSAIAEPFLLGLRFYDPAFVPGSRGVVPMDSLLQYFTPGRTFQTGVGDGLVRFGILIPKEPNPGLVNRRSRTDLASGETGTVTIESVQLIAGSINEPPNALTDYFITFSYDVTVGVYDAELDRAAGPGLYDFTAKDQARVVGAATLHLTPGR